MQTSYVNDPFLVSVSSPSFYSHGATRCFVQDVALSDEVKQKLVEVREKSDDREILQLLSFFSLCFAICFREKIHCEVRTALQTSTLPMTPMKTATSVNMNNQFLLLDKANRG